MLHQHRASLRVSSTSCRRHPVTVARAVSARSAACQDLQALLQRLPGMAAVLPGNTEVKQQILDILTTMERQNPHPNPLQANSSSSSSTAVGLQPVSELLGEWDLVFASNGTVVTRTPFAQALVSAATKVPGVGLSDIRQSLTVEAANPGVIMTTNKAEFGLGPFGSWQIGIKGTWTAAGPEHNPADTALVEFEEFNVRLDGWLGLNLPQQLPQVSLPVPGSSKRRKQQQQQAGPRGSTAGSSGLRRVALWTTSYLDDTWRVGRAGGSGNVFLFKRRKQL